MRKIKKLNEDKYYCGLDFHKNVSELCVMDRSGEIVDQVRVQHDKLLTYLSNKPHYHVAIEASGGVFDIVSRIENLGHKVTIINPALFRAIGVGGKKTDRKDSEALAQGLRLSFVPEVHKKTIASRRLNSLIVSRSIVVKARVSLTNHVRGIMREYGIAMPAGAESFWKEVQDRLKMLECEVIKKTLSGLVDQAGFLKDEEAAIEDSIKQLTTNDDRILRLQTVPGVGMLTACAFIAAIDDVNRFDNAKKIGSYLGLTPKERSSGNKRRLGRITKCGPELLRRFLIHGARAAMRYAPREGQFVRLWAERIENRSGHNKAVVALAHKNARICFALLRDGSTYKNSPKTKHDQGERSQVA
jgi:transposase